MDTLSLAVLGIQPCALRQAAMIAERPADKDRLACRHFLQASLRAQKAQPGAEQKAQSLGSGLPAAFQQETAHVLPLVDKVSSLSDALTILGEARSYEIRCKPLNEDGIQDSTYAAARTIEETSCQSERFVAMETLRSLSVRLSMNSHAQKDSPKSPLA